MDEVQLEAVMEIIMHSGEARGLYLKAIEVAQEGRFEEAEHLSQLGKKELILAHNTQTAMLAKESAGGNLGVNLLMIHSQDHLMTTMTIKDLYSVFLKIGKKLNHLGG